MANNQYSLYHFKTRSAFETKVINSSGKTYSEAMSLTTNPCYYKLCLVSATDTGKPFIYTHGREWDGQMLLGNQIPINDISVFSGDITANDTIAEVIGKIRSNLLNVDAKLENVKVGIEDVNSSIDDFKELYLTGTQVNALLTFKQDTISDLATIRAGAAKGATAMQAINGNFYGVCDSDADTFAKVVTIDGFPSTLTVGQRVTVKFTYASSNTDANNPMTLNVNGTGAYTIYRYGTTLADNGTTTSGWIANSIQNFTFDGTGWMRDYWNNTTYSNVSLGQGYATCSTAESTTAKTASLSSYALTTGGIVSVKFSNAVPASATLNINSKGAKSIYHKGAAIKAGVIKAGDVATFIYSSQYHLISVDRGMTTVTTSAEGLMSASDKTKLDGIATGATAVSESTVSGWGFTKNTGTYSKPSTGIPASDLASAVQTSLGKADTALQSYTEKYTGTITGIKMNGASKGTSGVVDLGTVLTAHQDISGKADKSSLATVATSGSYNDLSNKPTIPSAVTETTVSGWGFTKNSGTITKVQANGTDVASSGTANIPAASTSKYGVTKLSSATNSTSTSLAATASAVKSAYDLANGKQDKLTSGTNIKTINNTSLLGSGNIAISPAYSLVSKGTSGTTATLNPNTFYVWGTVSSLTLTLGTEVSGVANEYLFQFTSGTTATTLSLPSTVKWVGGEAPEIEANTTYQISIVNNLGVIGAFPNS